MLFLIDYDRKRGQMVKLERFDDSDRQKAEDARLELELSLNRHRIMREVVLLQAINEQSLRRTHRRYFENLAELVTSHDETAD